MFLFAQEITTSKLDVSTLVANNGLAVTICVILIVSAIYYGPKFYNLHDRMTDSLMKANRRNSSANRKNALVVAKLSDLFTTDKQHHAKTQKALIIGTRIIEELVVGEPNEAKIKAYCEDIRETLKAEGK